MRAGAVKSIVGLAIALGVTSAIPARSAARTPVFTTPHFAFHSDFEANLNDALIAAGLARKGGKPELFRSGDEAASFAELSPSARAGWDRAVDYYAEIISPGSSNSRPRFLLRAQLAGFDEDLSDASDREFVEIARSFRAAAAPAYRASRWGAQDAKNRRFLEDLKPRLAAYEEKTAARLENLYQKKWGSLPIPVDIVETVDWSGANTILRDPAGGHLLISNENPAGSALEVVFHEASHILMGRDAPLRRALDTAAGAAGFRLPGDLWHVVLFYTTGEAVREILEAGTASRYTPMLYEIFERGDWVEYRSALESAWRPYVDGKRPAAEAAASLVEELRKASRPPGM